MSKQIIIDGENSDWFEKAVFTLKATKKIPNNQSLFKHAEEIIEMELKKMPQSNIINGNKVNLNIKDANKLYMDQVRRGILKKSKLDINRTRCIINIFLYSTLAFASICIACFILTI